MTTPLDAFVERVASTSLRLRRWLLPLRDYSTVITATCEQLLDLHQAARDLQQTSPDLPTVSAHPTSTGPTLNYNALPDPRERPVVAPHLLKKTKAQLHALRARTERSLADLVAIEGEITEYERTQGDLEAVKVEELKEGDIVESGEHDGVARWSKKGRRPPLKGA